MTEAGTAYLAVERHKLDDFSPYVFKTTDFGKTWTALVNGLPATATTFTWFVWIPSIPVYFLRAPRLASTFLSTTVRTGSRFQLNLPPSPVNDLIIKNNDLVVATHGRSFWVLDNLSPIRQYSDSLAQQDAHLFTPAAASHTVFRGRFFGGGPNTGKNPTAGAVIDYWLKTAFEKAGQKAKNQTAIVPARRRQQKTRMTPKLRRSPWISSIRRVK